MVINVDIIDILLAKAMTSQGKTDTYVAKANRAAAKAEKAEQDAAAAIATVTAAADDITSAQTAATELLGTVRGALAEIEAAAVNNVDINDVNTEIKKLAHSINTVSNSSANTIQLTTTYPDNTSDVDNIVKLYKTYGNNEDGTMTQKAINTYVSGVKSELQTAINNIHVSGGGGVSNLGSENAGSIVVVGQDGNITTGDTTEQSVIEALIRSGVYQAKEATGLSIDYENKNTNRTQEATNSTNFNEYSMFGGRKRCNVADDGTITAFYGDPAYTEDGSNGQVMVYQPKFYYQRVPINTINSTVGKIIRKESLIISPVAQSGFKLHPAFIDKNGEEVEYILLSAYEGCVYDTSGSAYILNDNSGIDFNADKLSSIAGAKPVSGEKNTLNITNAEHLATNRGEGWHISNLASISVDQMLSIVEYGTFNTQDAIEAGICNLDNVYTYNRACQTGSTSSLGNSTGAAATSTNNVNGNTGTFNEAGKRAISYRGEENPFGNIWKFVGGVNVSGNGSTQGGIPYICKNFNYASTITSDYESVGFCLTNTSDWISGMGYGDEKYDWVFLPAECSNANSATPIGDSIWVTTNLNGVHPLFYGGNWLFGQKNGMFYYACDKDIGYSASPFSARLIFMPTKNTIHDNNYALWQSKMEA